MEKDFSKNAGYFAQLPVPVGEPDFWQWPSSAADHVLEIFGPQGEVFRHRPKKIAPKSYEYPFPSKNDKISVPVRRGHGGMTYINWTLGLSRMIDLSIDITFHTEPKGPAAVYLQLYDFNIGKTRQYFGFQYSFTQKEELRTKFIWSRWDTLDKANARVSGGGYIEALDYENKFVGIRYPYSWCKGTYTVHLAMRETDENGTWYEMYIYGHRKKEWEKVGGLRFPATDEGLPFVHDGGGSWCEVYGGTDSSKDITRFHLSYGGIYTCGRNIKAKEARFSYGEETPNSDISIDPDGRRIHVVYGEETTRRTPAGKYGLKMDNEGS